MGSALFEVGEVLGARGNTKVKKLRHGGALYVRITPAPLDSAGTLHLNLRGIKLKNTEGLFGKSDPFFEISAKVEAAGGLTWQPVYRSEHVNNDLNPNWKPCSLDMSRLCDGDMDRPILIEVFDWEKSGKHPSMGKFETSVHGLMSAAIPGADGGTAKGIDTSKAFQLMKKGKAFGQIVVTTAKVEGGSTSSAPAAMQQPLQPLIPPPASAAALSSDVPGFAQALNRPPPTFQNTATAVSAATAMSNLRISQTEQPAAAPFTPPVYSTYNNNDDRLPPPMAPPATVPSYNNKPSLKPQFVDYLTGGCELELSIAIDFTGSNGDPRKPGTLHYRHPNGTLNDYEKAITAVGDILVRVFTI